MLSIYINQQQAEDYLNETKHIYVLRDIKHFVRDVLKRNNRSDDESFKLYDHNFQLIDTIIP